MKIYFAGSIRGGRQDVERYQEIISFLKSYGEVLTEHVGDYSLSVKGQNQLDDTFIHDRDLDWLNSSNLIVAETSVPSLGVGYEIANAVFANIPVFVLHRRNTNQLSAMIKGSKNIECHEYDSIEEAIVLLKNRLGEKVHG
ncbi:nucleoside 2-deoxyribosyltransferase [Priestia megaterium]|uniref:nucleoside 2-deoxyribosyltransferase n=1 Tax=Priestia megaterium TaxID=1404 RepID=UPI000BF74523|nr:nucleoside 2-deoxyribosyltransferase [Priestia megaterium]MED4051019.1 nucleoside 2-deoxyribosyltransferase [Priestia megaterium]PEZ06096.1 nucleoside 2-deoxyribosyltransferase [Priestia megaterium]